MWNEQLVKEVREGRLAIYNDGTLEELRNLLEYCYPKDETLTSGTSNFYASSSTLPHRWTTCTTLPHKSIKEFYMKEETKYTKQEFPKDDFGVIVENNNGEEIVDYLVSKGFKNTKNWDWKTAKNGGTISVFKGTKVMTYGSPGFSSLNNKKTLEQLKQLDSNNMEKKIERYKVKENFREVCTKAFGGIPYVEWVFNVDSDYYNDLKEAKVLDIWAEPIYKIQEKIVSMNTFELKVTKDGIFYNVSENITGFVREMVANLGNFNKQYGDISKKYDCNIEEITFSKTGCQNEKTTFSQWKKVWEEYQLIKG